MSRRSGALLGCGAQLALDDDPLTLFGEVGGRAVLACAPECGTTRAFGAELGVPVRGIGIAEGDTLLGVELAHLRGAWETPGSGPGVWRDGRTLTCVLRHPVGGA